MMELEAQGTLRLELHSTVDMARPEGVMVGRRTRRQHLRVGTPNNIHLEVGMADPVVTIREDL